MYINNDGFRYTFYRSGFQKTTTNCRISLIDSEGRETKILATGEAKLNHKDKYNKKIGRRVALNRAFDSMETPRGIRIEVIKKLDDVEVLEAQGL